MKPNNQKTTEAETEAKKPLCKMSERQFREADVVHNRFCVTPPAGTPVEALLNPASWVHLARKLSPRDRIEAMPECGSWLADFVVLYKTDIGATVHLLKKWDLTSTIPEIDEEYEVVWKGPAIKWCICRKSDGEYLRKDFETQEKAMEAMINLKPKQVA